MRKKKRPFPGWGSPGPQEERAGSLTAEGLLDNLMEDYTGIKQKEIADVRRGMITREAFLGSADVHMREAYGDKATERSWSSPWSSSSSTCSVITGSRACWMTRRSLISG